MWVRKTPDQVSRDRKRKLLSPEKPVQMGLLISPLFFVMGIFFKLGFRKMPGSSSLDFMPWDQFLLYDAKTSLLLGGGAFLVCYLWQLLTGREVMADAPMVLCIECQTVKNKDASGHCPCGGKFVDLDEFEWIEEQKPDAAEESGFNDLRLFTSRAEMMGTIFSVTKGFILFVIVLVMATGVWPFEVMI